MVFHSKLISFTFVCLLGVSLPALAAVERKEASAYTKKANQQLHKYLNFQDQQDYEDASRGFVKEYAIPTKDENGKIIYNITAFDFLKNDKVPETVNPSLWRISQLNIKNGLYKVTDKIYQIRGMDLSNMTIIEGDEGLIIIDPLVSKETAQDALELYYSNVEQPKSGKRPVKAVIYTHSHEDHFGGVKGVTNEKDVKSGKVKVLAPDGFMEEAVSENIYAGNAMGRRALYMFGSALPYDEKGSVGAGLGQATSFGEMTLIPPTDTIKRTGETRKIDGVDIEFMMAPGTEAPAEMLLYFPQFKALNTAEDATHTLHNILTLRGAKVRDTNKWWKALDETVRRYGDKTDVVFAQHHWPKWGKENINKFLTTQRDGYKYMHDQTVNLLNKGYTPLEISEQIKFPPEIDKQWYMRGYYGTLNHNSKAIYQYYMGWYDGNPANLHPLPPVEAAKRYVEAMGGSEEAIKKAKVAFDKGDYRWVAEVMKHVVFANPDNKDAKNLQADAFEQLGYQSESGPWRNIYLAGAYELRNGVIKQPGVMVAPDILANTTPEMLFDYMGIRLNGPKAGNKSLKFNWDSGDGEQYDFWLENGVLMYRKGKQFDNVDASIKGDKANLAHLIMKTETIDDLVSNNKLSVEGDKNKINELTDLLDSFDQNFNIVTP